MSLGRLTSLYRDIGIYIYKYHFRGLNLWAARRRVSRYRSPYRSDASPPGAQEDTTTADNSGW